MSKQIHNSGKDVSSDSSIDKLQQALASKGFHIVEQSSTKLIDNIWAVSIRDKNCPVLTIKAYGLTKESAIKQAVIIFAVSVSTRFFWADYFLGKEIAEANNIYYANEKWFACENTNAWPKGILSNQLQDFYSLDGELNPNSLIDCISSNQARGICCIPFNDLRTDETTYFPINVIDNLYVDNGISSGKSVIDARINALTTILKSFIQFKVIADGIALPDIPESVLKQYPFITSSINNLFENGYSLVLKDASLNGNYPVIMALLFNQTDQTVSVGFGANLDYERALENSVISLFENTSSTKQETEAGFDMDEISSPQNLECHYLNSRAITAWKSLADKSEFEFFDWQKKYSLKDQNEDFELLCNITPFKENDIFISDYYEFEIPCCRIIIPSISEIYPVEDLIWENNNAGIKVRHQILNKYKSITECEQLIENLEDLDLDDEYLVSKLIGMPADSDSIFHDLSIAELILLLALKTQDNERIQEGCEWILHSQNLDQKRLKTYKCINTILQLDEMTNYAKVLERLYPRDILNDALGLIAGEDIFSLESKWKTHKSLITSYKKIINQ